MACLTKHFCNRQKDCDFVQACSEGDLEAVKQLLESANFQNIYIYYT